MALLIQRREFNLRIVLTTVNYLACPVPYVKPMCAMS